MSTDLKNPPCPDCHYTLNKLIGSTQLTTYPPQGCFGCDHCDFEGFVTYEFSEEMKKRLKVHENSPKKMAVGRVITNINWLTNFTRSFK